MEFDEIEEKYDMLMSSKLYDFNLDILNKSLTLKLAYENYLKKSFYKPGYTTVTYYELRFINLKELQFRSFGGGAFISSSLEDIGVFKIRENLFKISIESSGSLDIECERVELVTVLTSPEIPNEKVLEF